MFKPIEWLQSFFQTKPKRVDHRNEGQKVAIVLVHGFTGGTGGYVGRFREFAARRARHQDLGCVRHRLSLPGLRIDIPNLWAADPDIKKLSLASDDEALSIAVQRVREDCHRRA